MSSPGIILEKKEYLNLDRTLNDIKLVVNMGNLQINNIEKIYSHIEEFNMICIDISEVSDNIENRQAFILNIYDKSQDEYDERFDWILKGAKLKHIMDIESTYDCEEITLNFVYGYLKLNPDDFFWTGENWIYNYETIKKIKQLPFNKDWCNFPPEVFFDKMSKGEL